MFIFLYTFHLQILKNENLTNINFQSKIKSSRFEVLPQNQDDFLMYFSCL